VPPKFRVTIGDKTIDVGPADMARLSPLGLMYYHNEGRYMVPRHLVHIDGQFLRMMKDEFDVLIVLAPPGHAKSEYASKYAPAWFLGRNPSKVVLLLSYAYERAVELGTNARQVLQDCGMSIFGVRLEQRRSAGSNWWLANRNGHMYSEGLEGQVTGKHPDLIICDDLYKGPEDAGSPDYRDKLIAFFTQVVFPRLLPGTKLVIVNYRWNLRDIQAWLIERMAAARKRVRVIKFPAIAEESDVLGRKVGEALWPEKFPLSYLEQQRALAETSPHVWAALWQQAPVPAEGALFRAEWWRFYRSADLPNEFDRVVQSWDMAFKGKHDSDFVVGQVWGIKGARSYLLDQVRDRMDFSDALKAVQHLSAKWPQALLKLVEDKANGPAVISALKLKVPGLVAVNPQGGKESRAQSVLPLFAAGNVWLPDPDEQPWINNFLTEALSFPRGDHDDQVDAMSQCLRRFFGAKDRAAEEADPDPMSRRIKDLQFFAERVRREIYGVERDEYL